MLKDRRDDFDDNDDVDLTGMIHQYNEDNELRRKINEMKKQKESNSIQADFDPSDSALMGSTNTQTNEPRIPNIKADQDVEKTRVGFNDDGDKTLVIMDRKSRVEAKPEDMYDDYSYVEPQKQTTAFRSEPVEETDEYEDLKKVVKNKKDKKKDDFEEDEKAKRINKIIMISIISVISIVLIVGIGFGVKYMFFNSDSSDTETTTKEKEPTTNKKKPTTTPKDKDNIKDNSAIIAQLNAQLDTYQTQLDEVNKKLVDAQSQVNIYQGKLDAIPVLKQNMIDAETTMKTTKAEMITAEATKTAACAGDKVSSEACTTATNGFTTASAKAAQAETNYNLSNDAYSKEYNQTSDYNGKLKASQETVNALDKQKTDLETKVASTTTELAKYNGALN